MLIGHNSRSVQWGPGWAIIAVEMSRRILGNIARTLEGPMRMREQDVVYSLVEIRKFLEVTGQKTDYRHLTFYCDWAVHPRLEGTMAQGVVKLVDECESKFADNEKLLFPVEGREDHLREQLEDLFTLSRFRGELGLFLKLNGLRDDITDVDVIWIHFVTCYVLAVQECPLKCNSPGLQFVDEVTMSIFDIQSPFESDMNELPRLQLEWKWIIRTTGKEERIIAKIHYD
jgi:hypothetical protein